MDPIDFIDSIDIRTYLREIGYECEPIEASYLIYQSSKKTIDEKHLAWNWLIENTQDVPVPARNWLKGWDSLHGMLFDYMAIEKCLIEHLQESEPDTVYYANGKAIGCKTGFAQDYLVCFDEAMRRVEVEKSLPYAFDQDAIFRIEKASLEIDGDGDIPEVVGTYNTSGQLLSVYSPRGLNGLRIFALPKSVDLDVWDLSFDGMWFDVPIPFERGDVVRDLTHGHMFVLEGTVPWVYRERGWSSEEHGDATDMEAFGLCRNCIYEMIDGIAHHGDDAPYLMLEYASEDLSGNDKVLAAYGAYLKGGICLSDFLHCAQSYRRQSQNEDTVKIVSSIEKKFLVV